MPGNSQLKLDDIIESFFFFMIYLCLYLAFICICWVRTPSPSFWVLIKIIFWKLYSLNNSQYSREHYLVWSLSGLFTSWKSPKLYVPPSPPSLAPKEKGQKKTPPAVVHIYPFPWKIPNLYVLPSLLPSHSRKRGQKKPTCKSKHVVHTYPFHILFYFIFQRRTIDIYFCAYSSTPTF